MGVGFKELASLRGNDKLFEENSKKIDWSGALGEKKEEVEVGASNSQFPTDRNTIHHSEVSNVEFDNKCEIQEKFYPSCKGLDVTGNSIKEDIRNCLEYAYYLGRNNYKLHEQSINEMTYMINNKQYARTHN